MIQIVSIIFLVFVSLGHCQTTPKLKPPTGFRQNVLPNLPGQCGEVKFIDIESQRDAARLGEHPWVALIAYWHSTTEKTSFECHGALISQKYVLTAGHCIETAYDEVPAFVRLGEWNISSEKDCVEGVCGDRALDFKIDHSISTENQTGIDNMGLMRLVNSVNYTQWIQPVCLPIASHFYENYNYVGASFVFSGWKTNVKTVKQLSVVQNSFCENDLNLKEIFKSTQHFCIRKNEQLCGGMGPIYAIDLHDNGEPYWYVVGISSFHFIDSCPGYQTITRIVNFVDWINSNTFGFGV